MTCAVPCATFGLKVGVAGSAKFEVRIQELIANLPDLAVLVEPLLVVRRVLHEQIVHFASPLACYRARRRCMPTS
jgi:hypothetical protein